MQKIKSSLIILFLISPLYGTERSSEISLTGTTGNAHTRTFILKNNAKKDINQLTLKGKFDYFFAEDDHTLETEKYLVGQQLDWRYRNHPYLDYVFQRYTWDKDRSKNIKSRSSAGLGHGFDILKTSLDQIPKHRVFLELGGNYSWEGRRDNSYEEFGSARSYLVLYWDLHRNKTSIKQDIEYLYDFGEDNGSRINTNLSIKRNLKESIALKLGFEINYDSTPVGDAKTTDTLTNLFLVIDY